MNARLEPNASLTVNEEAASLLAELVAIKSLPGEERAIQEHIAKWFERNAIPVDLVDVEPGRPNLLVRLQNGFGPTLMINGHVDTASIDPRWDAARIFGIREGNCLAGLGSGDMKAGIAAAMLTVRELDRNRANWRGALLFTSVVDEEAFSKGAHAFIASGERVDYCIVTESSFDEPCLGAFGKILIRVNVAGKAAHASWPRRGVNAAVEASRFCAELAAIPLSVHPRITPSQCVLSLHAGPTIYESIVVPERAVVLINWHTVPGESTESIIAKLEAVIAWLDSPASFTFSIDPPYYPAWETPVDATIAEVFSRCYEEETGVPPNWAYGGYGDMNLFSTSAGIPTVMFGPRGGNFHEAEEWCDLTSLDPTIRILINVAHTLLPA